MFGWLRKLFRHKEPAGEVTQETYAEIDETKQPEQPVVQTPERLAPHSTHEPERPEKICPKCGSPNDKFVHVCWMCKAEI